MEKPEAEKMTPSERAARLERIRKGVQGGFIHPTRDECFLLSELDRVTAERDCATAHYHQEHERWMAMHREDGDHLVAMHKERDAARARAEKAERERDEARAERRREERLGAMQRDALRAQVAKLETAIGFCSGSCHGALAATEPKEGGT